MGEVNVYDTEFEYDESDPVGYRAGSADVGRAAGGTDTNVRAYELPQGQSVCPYHYEYEEEWLLVLDGDVELRTPEGRRPLRRGDLVHFTPGPDGAHKVTNREEAPARVLMFSTAREPAVAVYPDSNKIGVWPGRAEDKILMKRADGAVDYWDGET